jgi:2-dehydropantoate 2-reductase
VDGNFRLPQVQAARDSREIGPCDLVIITLKATSNHLLPGILPPLLHDKTVVLTLQNGLSNEAFLAGVCGPDHVIGGLCFVCINQTSPGVIEHYAQGLVTIGEREGQPRERTEAIASLFADSGFPCKTVPSLEAARWRKLVWNIPFNGLSIAAGGIDTGRILGSPSLKRLACDLMHEVIAAAEAQGHRFPGILVEDQITRTRGMGAYRPSSLIDWQQGREVEIDAIWRRPCEFARRIGQPMPRVETLLGLLDHLAPSPHA